MYKFVKDDMDGFVEVSFEPKGETWMDIVEDFQRFLAGCGFVFIEDFDMADVLNDKHDELLKKKWSIGEDDGDLAKP
jgi:hypothetical protein